MTRLLLPRVMLAALTLSTVAACGGTSAKPLTPESAFNSQGGGAVPCMAHQTHDPVKGDRVADQTDVPAALTVLHYYTVNGNKPYCDGKHATPLDRAWLSLYLAEGADPKKITRAQG